MVEEEEGFCVWQIVDIGRRPDEVIEDDLRGRDLVVLWIRPYATEISLLSNFCPSNHILLTLAAGNVNG